MARLDSITVPISRKLKHYLRVSAEQDGRTLAAYVRNVLDQHMRQGGFHDGERPASDPEPETSSS